MRIVSHEGYGTSTAWALHYIFHLTQAALQQHIVVHLELSSCGKFFHLKAKPQYVMGAL